MKASSRKCLKICCLATLLVLLLLIVTLVILYFTILKPKQPEVVATPVSLRNIEFGFFPIIILNVTLGIDVFIKNRNYAGFKYDSTSTTIYYRGGLVGEAPIEAGSIGPRTTKIISTTVEFFADNFASNPDFVPDVLAGMLNLTSTSRMEGKVVLLKVFKMHATTSVDCDITVSLKNRNISSNCVSKVKI